MEKEKDLMCACNNVDCFAHSCGNCILLTSTDFKGRPCPFYKTDKQYKEDKKWENTQQKKK